MSFWDVIWFIIVSFAFIAYLMLLFWIIGDMFRNKEQSGWIKALWVIFLILIPLLTALVYLIVHGQGMTERSAAEAVAVREAQDSYIRQVAGKSPAEQIADAKGLRDAGTISEEEYQALKAKALG